MDYNESYKMNIPYRRFVRLLFRNDYNLINNHLYMKFLCILSNLLRFTILLFILSFIYSTGPPFHKR